jgi:hypothetical protein
MRRVHDSRNSVCYCLRHEATQSAARASVRASAFGHNCRCRSRGLLFGIRRRQGRLLFSVAAFGVFALPVVVIFGITGIVLGIRRLIRGPK